VNEQAENLSTEQTKLMLDYARLVRMERDIRDIVDVLRSGGIGSYVTPVKNKSVMIQDLFKEKGLWPT
jgi:hypothetical protein